MIEILLGVVALFMGALAYLMVKVKQRVDGAATMVAQVLENAAAAPHPVHHGHDHDDWPASAAVQVGHRAPFDLPHATGDAWTVAVLGADLPSIELILRQLMDREYFEQRYRFALVSAESSGTGGGAVQVPEEMLDFGSETAAILLDPEMIVRGAGAVEDGDGLLRFILEGELHGFGPAHGGAVQVAH